MVPFILEGDICVSKGKICPLSPKMSIKTIEPIINNSDLIVTLVVCDGTAKAPARGAATVLLPIDEGVFWLFNLPHIHC